MLTIGQGASGILQFEQITARTITIGGSVTIFANGIFRANTLGNQRGHQAIITGSLINNGTLDFGNTAGRADLKFTGTTNESVTGSGAFNFLTLTVDKGTSQTPVLEFINVNPFTVLNTALPGFLNLLNGTFKLSSTTTQTNRVFSTAVYTIPSTAGFWLNSSSTTVGAYGVNQYLTVNGLLRISSGTMNIGAGGFRGDVRFGTGAIFTLEESTPSSWLTVRTSINNCNY